MESRAEIVNPRAMKSYLIMNAHQTFRDMTTCKCFVSHEHQATSAGEKKNLFIAAEYVIRNVRACKKKKLLKYDEKIRKQRISNRLNVPDWKYIY